jgi:hypothetical protein
MGAIPFILFAGNYNVLEGFASTQGIIKMTKGSGITAIGLAALLPAEFFLTASGLANFRASRKSKRRSHRAAAPFALLFQHINFERIPCQNS